MSFIEIVKIEDIKLKDAILLEGLPGVGNVGKLAAMHLIEELKAKKCTEIYSSHFPPQVLIDDDGVVKLVNNELYYYKGKGKNKDLLFLVGEYQGMDSSGQYDLCNQLINLAKDMGVTSIYTLGGYGLGKLVPEPRVLGAATSDKMVELFKSADIEFIDGEPGAGIVGASGLLLGLGKLQGIEGGCLMGETSGYMVDPKSASVVLKSLQKLLGIKIDLEELEKRAKQVDNITNQLKENESEIEDKVDVNYIG
ncbi:MAG: proteasome assembly chaperone family protein [Euryarchaeota archaeon]|nr:proteasome assembly chaperone family protein [Euryarchaeota archaeon]